MVAWRPLGGPKPATRQECFLHVLMWGKQEAESYFLTWKNMWTSKFSVHKVWLEHSHVFVLFFSFICGCLHTYITRVELQQEPYGLVCLLFGPGQRKWPTPVREHQLSVAQRQGHPPSLSLLLLTPGHFLLGNSICEDTWMPSSEKAGEPCAIKLLK